MPDPTPVSTVTLALLGLITGSFVNVVAHRVPQRLSVVKPASACPACGHHIRARDNIPVVSWLLLKGRCRDCGARISVRYPVVEALTAAVFVAAGFLLGVTWALPAYLWFGATGIALILTDIDHKRLPDRIVLVGIIGGAALLAVAVVAGSEFHWSDLGRGIGGAAAYFGFMFLLAELTRGGFGFGDVKAASLLGLFLAFRSWDALVVGVVAAFLIGGGFAVVVMVLRLQGRRDAIPFGPSLIAAAMLAVVWGSDIADWYLRR